MAHHAALTRLHEPVAIPDLDVMPDVDNLSGIRVLVTAGNRYDLEDSSSKKKKDAVLVSPGDVITRDKRFMLGHGTYETPIGIHSSFAGYASKTDRLISVHPLNAVYEGAVGDVVVGRIVRISKDLWHVDISSRMEAVLMLTAINLPGGELRKKTEEDRAFMRKHMNIGDLISAEVQRVTPDGILLLHTRSLKYGKLPQGVSVSVPHKLIKRTKTHFHSLPCGVELILAANGWIFISPGSVVACEGGFEQNLDPVSQEEMEAVARVKNVVETLSENRQALYSTSVMAGYEMSLQWSVQELNYAAVRRQLAEFTDEKLRREFLSLQATK